MVITGATNTSLALNALHFVCRILPCSRVAARQSLQSIRNTILSLRICRWLYRWVSLQGCWWWCCYRCLTDASVRYSVATTRRAPFDLARSEAASRASQPATSSYASLDSRPSARRSSPGRYATGCWPTDTVPRRMYPAWVAQWYCRPTVVLHTRCSRIWSAFRNILHSA